MQITREEARARYIKGQPVYATTTRRVGWKLPASGEYGSHAPIEDLFYRSIPTGEGEVLFYDERPAISDRRFLVTTYNELTGADSGMDYDRLSAAIDDAKSYEGLDEYAAVYDRVAKIAYVVFGDIKTRVFADHVTVLQF